jgi:hypothetical protein
MQASTSLFYQTLTDHLVGITYTRYGNVSARYSGYDQVFNTTPLLVSRHKVVFAPIIVRDLVLRVMRIRSLKRRFSLSGRTPRCRAR